jgi:hypothetical protein
MKLVGIEGSARKFARANWIANENDATEFDEPHLSLAAPFAALPSSPSRSRAVVNVKLSAAGDGASYTHFATAAPDEAFGAAYAGLNAIYNLHRTF